MELDELPISPPPPELVITQWASSRGQDLLGLRAPAERIATRLMDGVTTISPLVRYIGFRAWVISRYASLGGLDNRDSFYAFAGKCEAALVIGHKLADESTFGLIGSREATRDVEAGGPLMARKLTQNLAMDAYAGPSQDLAIAIRRAPVPALSIERGRPLAAEVAKTLDGLHALTVLDTKSDRQELNSRDLEALAAAFPMQSPSGVEREMLVEAVCPTTPRPGEYARLAAYCHLLHLATPQRDGVLDEDAVFNAAIEGDELSTPRELYSVADGWLRFLVRDSLVAVHERAVTVALDMLAESPHAASSVDSLVERIVELEPTEVLENVGLRSLSAASPVGCLYEAITDGCAPTRARSGLRRWNGSLNELAVFRGLKDHPEPAAVALLPVVWILACLRAGESLEDNMLSIDALSGTSIVRVGLRDVVLPTVRSWRGSAEPLGRVIARLVRRSVDQHLAIAWYRMQADPRRNVSLVVSDGTNWIGVGTLAPGRATSRLYQAVNWLSQLGLISDSEVTSDGKAVLDRGLRTLAGARSAP